MTAAQTDDAGEIGRSRSCRRPLSAGERRVLYLDAWGGVSGDMMLSALLDLDREEGWLERVLRTCVAGLGLPPSVLKVSLGLDHGYACTRVEVDEAGCPPLPNLARMEAVLEHAKIAPSVKRRAIGAVRTLIGAESCVHGLANPAQVHLHELAGVDTLVDVVGTIALMEALDVESVVHGPVPVGSGRVLTAHGEVGAPAPATLELLKGRCIYAGGEVFETVTPTGALLLRELAAGCDGLPPMTVDMVGYGAGRRQGKNPNLLRAILGRVAEGAAGGEAVLGARDASHDAVIVLEANLDDMTPEVLAFVHQRLMEAGALDAWIVPAVMKKGRPGWVLSTLCGRDAEGALVDLIFRESSTLGVRRREIDRLTADRRWVRVTVEGHPVNVKVALWDGEVVTCAAEYEDAARAARELGWPLALVMQEAVALARDRSGP